MCGLQGREKPFLSSGGDFLQSQSGGLLLKLIGLVHIDVLGLKNSDLKETQTWSCVNIWLSICTNSAQIVVNYIHNSPSRQCSKIFAVV